MSEHTIFWGTGFEIGFPFLDPDLLPWDNGVAVRVANLLKAALEETA